MPLPLAPALGRGDSEALAVENDGVVVPVETAVAGVCPAGFVDPAVLAPVAAALATPEFAMPEFAIELGVPGRLSPALGTVIVMESVPLFAIDVGSLGVNGFELEALLAASLTVWSMESGIAKPLPGAAPLELAAPADEAGDCPKFAESGEKVDAADVGAPVGSEYPVVGLVPAVEAPGAG